MLYFRTKSNFGTSFDVAAQLQSWIELSDILGVFCGSDYFGLLFNLRRSFFSQLQSVSFVFVPVPPSLQGWSVPFRQLKMKCKTKERIRKERGSLIMPLREIILPLTSFLWVIVLGNVLARLSWVNPPLLLLTVVFFLTEKYFGTKRFCITAAKYLQKKGIWILFYT